MTSVTGGVHEYFGTFGRGYAEFNEPSGVTMDRFGNFLIADSKNFRIHVRYVCFVIDIMMFVSKSVMKKYLQ